MIAALELLFWVSFGLLVWTHLAYPLVIAALARLRPRPVRADDVEPQVALIIPAHDERAVIEAKLDNALALDYPRDRLRILVASDGSQDGTDDIVRSYADRGVVLLASPRRGKTASQDRAVSETDEPIIAFGDANVMWDAGALRMLVRPFADPRVAMACGRVRLVNPAGGTNREGLYWRYEMWLRAHESAVHSITGSNGGIYAVRREAYSELDPRIGHDLTFPFRIVQQGYRAVYEPRALALENMATDIEDEFRRKVRMFSQSWTVVTRTNMLNPFRVGPLYWLELVSHRLLRYSTGLLHLVWLLTSLALVGQGGVYAALLAAQVAGIGLALVSMALGGKVRVLGVLQYYLVLNLGTLVALGRSLRGASPATWDKAVGTR